MDDAKRKVWQRKYRNDEVLSQLWTPRDPIAAPNSLPDFSPSRRMFFEGEPSVGRYQPIAELLTGRGEDDGRHFAVQVGDEDQQQVVPDEQEVSEKTSKPSSPKLFDQGNWERSHWGGSAQPAPAQPIVQSDAGGLYDDPGWQSHVWNLRQQNNQPPEILGNKFSENTLQTRLVQDPVRLDKTLHPGMDLPPLSEQEIATANEAVVSMQAALGLGEDVGEGARREGRQHEKNMLDRIRREKGGFGSSHRRPVSYRAERDARSASLGPARDRNHALLKELPKFTAADAEAVRGSRVGALSWGVVSPRHQLSRSTSKYSNYSVDSKRPATASGYETIGKTGGAFSKAPRPATVGWSKEDIRQRRYQDRSIITNHSVLLERSASAQHTPAPAVKKDVVVTPVTNGNGSTPSGGPRAKPSGLPETPARRTKPLSQWPATVHRARGQGAQHLRSSKEKAPMKDFAPLRAGRAGTNVTNGK